MSSRQLIGYVLFFNTLDEHTGHLGGAPDDPIAVIEDLYVKPSYRGRGIGTQLFRRVLKVRRYISAIWQPYCSGERKGLAQTRLWERCQVSLPCLTMSIGSHMVNICSKDLPVLTSIAKVPSCLDDLLIISRHEETFYLFFFHSKSRTPLQFGRGRSWLKAED